MPDLDCPRWTVLSPVIEKACQGVACLPCSRVWAARRRYRIWLRSLPEVNGSQWRYRPWRRKWSPKHWRRDWPAKATRSQPARPPPASLSLPQGARQLTFIVAVDVPAGRGQVVRKVRGQACGCQLRSSGSCSPGPLLCADKHTLQSPQATEHTLSAPHQRQNATNALHVKSNTKQPSKLETDPRTWL